MLEQPVTIAIIIDPEYGDRLCEIALTGPVWLTASAINRSAVENYWRTAGPSAHPVTYWSEPRTGSTEEEWLGIIDDLELHHSKAWSGPGIAAIHVIGVPLTEEARNAFREFGYQITHVEGLTFRAIPVVQPEA
jgi:hypothetical protein